MKLFEPGKIGNLSVKNRIVMAAMGIGALAEPDGRLSQRGIDYYLARARGGTGLIITGAARNRQIERSAYPPLGSDLMIDGRIATARLSELADAVHDYGAKVAVQLMPGHGRIAGTEVRRRGEPVAPSPLPCFFDSTVTARELSTKEVEQLIGVYEFAAEAVRAAGVDAIEINNHAGYLADQFLTSLWNKRKDKYGGSLDGRLRFLLEIIESIRKGAGPDFPILVKFGLTHFLPGGRDVEEGLEIARRLEAAGIAALDIDGGCYETWYWAKCPTYLAPGSLVELAEMVKKTVRIPVITVGKLGYPKLAEQVLQEGKADFISLGRALLADPEWPNKVREGRTDEIRPCLGDLEGCSGRTAEGKYISCVVNPATGMEKELTLQKATKQKVVIVVGGGPGGMEAARVAALRGHRVTLLEKEDVLGGNLVPASVPAFKRDYRSLIDYLSAQIARVGVNVELGKAATPELVCSMKPEVVFIATGSTPLVPVIPGVRKKKVVTAVDVLLGHKDAGKRVVVLGGNLVGCETALHLAQKGKKVTVIESSDMLARDMHLANRMLMLKLLADNGVETKTGTTVQQITDRGVSVADSHGSNSTIEAETVVLALGFKSEDELCHGLESKVPEVYAIGDCVEPRKVMNAIWEGFRLARLI